uniref:hypothetical protein n=1 Tax=Oceanispirochaeta sp. TaxID=2035350 RepID=UPI00261A7AE2
IRCSQIADVLEYVHTGYIMDAPLNNRHCEYALNLLDVVNRFKGGDIGTRFSPEMRTALILTGETIDPSDFSAVEKKKDRYKVLLDRIKNDLQGLSLDIEEFL